MRIRFLKMTVVRNDASRVRRRRLFVWLLSGIGILTVALYSISPDPPETVSIDSPVRPVPTNQESLYIFATSKKDGEVLFSKTSAGDLWLRDANGGERCLASNVVKASFSPDGKNFAYSTSDEDLFIQSAEGARIVQLARVRDYSWSSNSMAVTFVAIAAVDYPELEQMLIYDLNSNQTRYLAPGD